MYLRSSARDISLGLDSQEDSNLQRDCEHQDMGTSFLLGQGMAGMTVVQLKVRMAVSERLTWSEECKAFEESPR